MSSNEITESNSEPVDCKNCAHRIIKEAGLYVVCSGPCNNSFHIPCVGVSKAQMNALSRGVLWLCNTCLLCFQNWKKSARISPPFDASPMIHDISELKQQVSRIMQVLDASSSTRPSSSDAVLHHSTPITNAALKNGSNVSCDGASAIASDHTKKNESLVLNLPVDDLSDRSFSLLLTNIDNTASEDDIREMVCECLGAPTADCENVVKLVPRRMDCTSFDFISFKVVLRRRWKLQAMSANTWPTTIKFREFVNHRNQTWKPSHT